MCNLHMIELFMYQSYVDSIFYNMLLIYSNIFYLRTILIDKQPIFIFNKTI